MKVGEIYENLYGQFTTEIVDIYNDGILFSYKRSDQSFIQTTQIVETFERLIRKGIIKLSIREKRNKIIDEILGS
jgi:hypothetical protein